MKITTILFDLDGTLLPMDYDAFTKLYFGSLAKKLAPHGYEPNKLIKSIWSGTKAMVLNDGQKTNEEVFWDKFTSIYGEQSMQDMPYFEEFYQIDFDNAKQACSFNSQVPKLIKYLKLKGFKLALATNPLFPSIATQKRTRWAGLEPDDFAFITTYENSNHCKPNLEYYKDITTILGVEPSECLMVGNDVSEDMVAESLGMKVFLLTDCLLNKDEKDISKYPQGSFNDLVDYISNL